MSGSNVDYRRLGELVQSTLHLAGFPAQFVELLIDAPGFEIEVTEEGEFAGVLASWRTEKALLDAAMSAYRRGDLEDPARRLYEAVIRQMCDVALQVLTAAGFRASVEGGYAAFDVRVEGNIDDAILPLVDGPHR